MTVDPKYLSEDYEPSVEEMRAECELLLWCSKIDRQAEKKLSAQTYEKAWLQRFSAMLGGVAGGAASLGAAGMSTMNMATMRQRFGAMGCELTPGQMYALDELAKKRE